MNPVPCILVSDKMPEVKNLRNGRLADVAPTLLELMGVEKGKEMTGVSLVPHPANNVRGLPKWGQ